MITLIVGDENSRKWHAARACQEFRVDRPNVAKSSVERPNVAK